jgi:hypothetical protein
MAGRGSTTFQKRQKEQQRKEKRAEKLARRQGRKLNPPPPGISDADPEPLDGAIDGEADEDTVETEPNSVETGVKPAAE